MHVKVALAKKGLNIELQWREMQLVLFLMQFNDLHLDIFMSNINNY